jgi:hypothetical protein
MNSCNNCLAFARFKKSNFGADVRLKSRSLSTSIRNITEKLVHSEEPIGMPVCSSPTPPWILPTTERFTNGGAAENDELGNEDIGAWPHNEENM